MQNIVDSYKTFGSAHASTVLVFFHGWMSCGNDVEKSMDWSKISMDYDILVVIPTAINLQWFSYNEETEKKVKYLAHPSEILGLKSIRQSLLHFFENFMSNKTTTLLVGGYSQGGSVAIDIGLISPRISSIWVSSSAPYTNMLREYNLEKKIYVYHGFNDTVFDFERVKTSFHKFSYVNRTTDVTNHWNFMEKREFEHFHYFLSSEKNR